MERFFILGDFNTWYDWSLILTAKDTTPPEPKTNYVSIDGMSGTIDLSEALTGEVTYQDRTVTASFWTDKGNIRQRAQLLKEITAAVHGKKIKIVEPDDPEHYFLGRVTVKPLVNSLPYTTFSIKADCEPWRYAVNETVRSAEVNSDILIRLLINNNGIRTLSPLITIEGSVTIDYNGIKTPLTTGSYKVSDIKLLPGVNVVGVSGNGSVTFTYREADL